MYNAFTNFIKINIPVIFLVLLTSKKVIFLVKTTKIQSIVST